MRISRTSSRSSQILLPLWYIGTLVNAIAIPVNHDGGLKTRNFEILDSFSPDVPYLLFVRGEKEGIHSFDDRGITTPPKSPKPVVKPEPVPVSGPDGLPQPANPKPLIPGDPVPGSLTPENPKPLVPEEAKPLAPETKPAPEKPPAAAPVGELKSWEKPLPSEAEVHAQAHVERDKAFFWSGTADKKRDYATQAGLTTDSRAYPPGYTRQFHDENGNIPDYDKYDTFALYFSRGFANKASGEVHVMVPWEKGPRHDRRFVQDEWPILKARYESGEITKFTQVNPDNFAETRDFDPTRYGFSKRTVIDLDNIPWDVDMYALEETWKRAEGD